MCRVFELSGVPQDEANAMRDVLESRGIEYYETPKASFGPGGDAIWVHNEQSAQKARTVIDDAQSRFHRHTSQSGVETTEPMPRTRRIAVAIGVAITVVYVYIIWSLSQSPFWADSGSDIRGGIGQSFFLFFSLPVNGLWYLLLWRRRK